MAISSTRIFRPIGFLPLASFKVSLGPLSHALFACALLLSAARLAAHPTGVSKVDFFLKPDTLECDVDVNRDDLYFALGNNTLDKVPRSEYDLLNDRIALYFQSRIPISFDKPQHGAAKVIRWGRPPGMPPGKKMDSLSLADTTLLLRFAWPIPAGATRLDAQVKLFAELQVQPLAHVRVHWKDSVVHRRFLGLDGRMSIPIAPDSLDAMYAKATAPAASGSEPEVSGDEEGVFVRFLTLGFTHILPHGLDHILFVLGLFFFSTLMRPLLVQVTAFTIAHSITLGLAMAGTFSLPSSVVEPLIALSIVVVAMENIFFRKLRPSRWIIVFLFGLIHGMGFAGVLRGLGLPEGQFLSTLISFNVGVEFGQLAVIALAFAATFWARGKTWYFKGIVVPVSVAISIVGLYWSVVRVMQ